MSSNSKPRVLGATGSALAGLWQAYASWTTASQLPSDAGWMARMLADPPIYLPWLMLAGFLLLLAWSLWPRKQEETGGADSEVSASYGSMAAGRDINANMGDKINQTHSGSGHNIGRVDNLQVGPRRLELTDEVVEDIASELRQRGLTAVKVDGIGNNTSWAMAEELRMQLRNRGFDVPPAQGQTFERMPGLERPLTFQIQKDGSMIILIDARVMV